MADKPILGMLEPSGRLRYAGLVQYAQVATHGVFIAQFLYPIFAGTLIRQGELKDAARASMTMSFKVEDIQEEMSNDPSGLRRAIYPLIRKPDSLSKQGFFTVGRDDDNDLIMVDYTISRHHARIRIDGAHIHLTDLGSTNGTAINEERLPPNKEFFLETSDEVTFGRYHFAFMPATELYVRLRS